MKLDLVACDAPPAELREAYFASLPEPQIHHMERLVSAARVFRFGDGGGYLAVHEGAVVEFFAEASWLPQLSQAFEAAAAETGATSAVLKSYDTLALVAATGRPARIATIGVNCTAWSDERYEPPARFIPRPGTPADVETVAAIGPGLFSGPEEIAPDLAGGRITIYEVDGAPVGAGVLSPVREGSDVLDVGVGVLPDWRGRGLGEQIVRHLKVHCLHTLKARPVCGCAVENVASRRTLENAGFLTRHRLLEISWGD
jgi:GNAT superfamily N-acetyltransferase